MFVRALNGTKYTGDSFHDHLVRGNRDLAFKPSLEYPHTCIKPSVKSCGYKYDEYNTTWVDDDMNISDNKPISIMKDLEATHVLQDSKEIF